MVRMLPAQRNGQSVVLTRSNAVEHARGWVTVKMGFCAMSAVRRDLVKVGDERQVSIKCQAEEGKWLDLYLGACRPFE